MRGLRLADTYGFDLPKSKTKTRSLIIYECDELSCDAEIMDWVNEDTGETLSGYKPNTEIINLLKYRTDVDLQ